jgi:hypothetical protein
MRLAEIDPVGAALTLSLGPAFDCLLNPAI